MPGTTKLVLGKKAAGPVLPGRTIELPVAKADAYIKAGIAVSIETLAERVAAGTGAAPPALTSTNTERDPKVEEFSRNGDDADEDPARDLLDPKSFINITLPDPPPLGNE